MNHSTLPILALVLAATGTACIDYDGAVRSFCAQAERQRRSGICGLDGSATDVEAGRISVGRVYGGTGDDQVSSAFIGNGGEVWIAGAYDGTGNFGLDDLTSAGGTDAFVAKIDALGTPVWSRRLGSAGNDRAVAIRRERVLGTFEGPSLDLGNGTVLSTASARAAFLVHLASGNGDATQARLIDGSAGSVIDARALAVGTETDRTAAVGSVTSGELVIDGATLAGAGSDWVLGLRADLSYAWHAVTEGCAFISLDGVALDDAEDVYVVGRGQGDGCALGGAPLFSGLASGTTHAFLAKFSGGATGLSRPVWIRPLGQADRVHPATVAAGYNVATFAVTASEEADQPTFNAVAFKFGRDGALVLPELRLSANAIRLGGAGLDGTDHLWLVGTFEDSLLQIYNRKTYQQQQRSTTPGTNVFVGTFDTLGNTLWIRFLHGASTLEAHGLAMEPTQAARVAQIVHGPVLLGSFTGQIDLDTNLHVTAASSGTDGFLFRVSP